MDDIWKNDEQPDVKHIDPKDDKRRKGWYNEISVIEDKLGQMYRKLVDAGKVLEWNDNREDVIQIRIHQGPHFRIVDNEEGRKHQDWFERMEARRALLSGYLLHDMDKRGSPLDYKKKKK